ncbi:Hypothetical protein A7982_11452 [Minicystis rosea]|nr:Hypothetical protein A7982_11452 [Minicystis rosea]
MRAKPWARLALAAVVIMVTGCQKTVDDVCSDLDDNCPDVGYRECMSDGQALESLVSSRGCGDLFDDYLDCVSDASCGWRSACADAKAALNACTGAFPE